MMMSLSLLSAFTACTDAVPDGIVEPEQSVDRQIDATCAGAIDAELQKSTCAELSSHLCEMWDRAKAICDGGKLRRFQLERYGEHRFLETILDFKNTPVFGDGLVEMRHYDFALEAQPGGDPKPLWRCVISEVIPLQNPTDERDATEFQDDFLSRDEACDGKANSRRAAWSGYTYAPNTPNTKTAYQCLHTTSGHHFVSFDPACAGQTVAGTLGNVGQ